MRPVFTLAAVAVLAACCSVLPASADSKALQILKQGIKADGNVVFTATVEIRTFVREGEEAVYVQKLYQGGGNRRRVEVVSPAREKGRLIVSDGVREWEYRPRAKIVQERALRPLDDVQEMKLDQLDLVSDTLHATYLGIQTIAGRRCHVVAVKPPDGRVVRKKLWLDVSEYTELKWERYSRGGKLVSSWNVTQIDFPADIDESLFSFKIPRGANKRKLPAAETMSLEKAQQRAGFRAVVPSYLPTGFHFAEDHVAVSVRDGRKALWLRFLDGVDSFSIFQSPKLNKGPTPPGRASYWETGGYSFLLVGRLSDEDKEKVKKSTQR